MKSFQIFSTLAVDGFSQTPCYGTCQGSDISQYPCSRQECAHLCESEVNCEGFIYCLPTKQTTHFVMPCSLKLELCQDTVDIDAYVCTSYFKTQIDGKAL